jgi:hypothetical protein
VTFPVNEEGRNMRGMREIDSWMQHIWKEVVKKEYDNDRILEESNLHSTVYFHLRKLIESSGKKELFVYSEMPFSTTKKGKGKKNPRVDLAIVILDNDSEPPALLDLLAVIELKHYEIHYNSIGVNKDLDHLIALRKGIYYPYKPTRNLIPQRAYFLYLVDEGKTPFNSTLQYKIGRLKKKGYLKVFLGHGDKGKFLIQR